MNLKVLMSGINNIHIKELLQGTSIAFIMRLFAFAIGYVFFLLLSRYFGAGGVGVYALANSSLMILGFLASLGTNGYLLKETAKKENNSLARIFSLFKSILVITFFSSLFIALVLVFCNDFIIRNFIVDTIPENFFIVIALLIPLFVFVNLTSAFFRGLKRILLSEFFLAFGIQSFNLIILFYYILSESFHLKDVLNLYVWTFVSLFIFAIYLLTSYRSKVKQTNTRFLISKKEILKVALPMSVASFILLLFGHIDNFMISNYMTLEGLGQYNIAVKIAMMTSIVLAAINSIVTPKISELFHGNHLVELQKIIQFSSKILLFTSLVALVLIYVFDTQLLALFGEKFNNSNTIIVLYILALTQFISTVTGSTGSIMTMTGHQKHFQLVMVIALVFKIILNIVLIPTYGLIGAAIASLIITAVWNLYLVYYIKKKLHLSTLYNPFLKG